MSTAVVTGKIVGATAAGSVSFTPSGWAGWPASSTVQGPSPITVPVAANGSFSATLWRTDNAEPPTWCYRVACDVPGVSAEPFYIRVDGPGDIATMIGWGDRPTWTPGTPPWAIPDGRYAPLDHAHAGYAPATHTHSQYAPATHTHSQYAPATHTHSQYATTAQVSALDSRFIRSDAGSIAVFVGTSNVDDRAGSWVAKRCTARGKKKKNYAVGGMGYNFDTSNSFDKQLDAAIADTSFANSDVRFVFICDGANDARSGLNVLTAAGALVTKAKANFPNARIIILPVLISTYTIDRQKLFLEKTGDIISELRSVALLYGVEMIEHSWSWHLDDPSLILPSEVHYTASGYNRIVYWVQEYLAGRPTVSNRGPSAPIYGSKFAGRDDGTLRRLLAQRDGEQVRASGHFSCTSTAQLGDVICTFPVGMRPNQDSIPVPIFNHSSGSMGFGTIGLAGDLQTWQQMLGGNQFSVYSATWAYV